MEITRLFDLLDNYIESYPNQDVALACKKNNAWRKYSIQEYVELANALSYSMIALGIKSGDKIGIVSGNRPEWNIIDFATMQIGAVSTPIYPTISQDDYKHILNHAEMKMIFIEGKELHKKLEPILPEMKNLKEIITFLPLDIRYKHFDQLVELGKQNPQPEKLSAIKRSIKETDIATIIYTSGTTGIPKGVMLSHSNIINNFKNVAEIPAKWNNKALSFLPICHAYERMLVYLYHYLGISIYYVESLATISQNIKEVNPTMMSCVPRLLEKIYDKLYSSGEKLMFAKRIIYYWAFKLATRYQLDKNNFWYSIKLKIADKLIYSQWRAAIGGNFDIIVSGGSAIQSQIASFFSAIGMPVFEGYGLSETSPVIAVSRRGKNQRKFGTVGIPLPGVEVKISEKDEILCRGHNVMMGYYKDPELTSQTIDSEGWFHTGDTGKFTPEGLLVITGRLKNIFKSSFGKYINPEIIESKFCESHFIENIFVTGENKKFAAALIVPDFQYLKSWCETNNITYSTNREMIDNADVNKKIREEIKLYNSFFGDYEQIKCYKLIADEWNVNNGTLSPTLKIKRQIIVERYADVIEKLFD
ncbi:MAG: long-chain fatty acid--CoA ligase [Prevotellaceae bacterium]|jgi:long-chain acyl-CoA synthetase|nr:long-chain fatty acid--CoA ligase [Prevotellaceae bacterium]